MPETPLKTKTQTKIQHNKKVPIIVTVLLLIAFLAFLIPYVVRQLSRGGPTSNTPTQLILDAGTTGQIIYKLEVVTDPTDQETGLGGRSRLAENTGMLFAYQESQQRCMWMKNMRFNIDIVWTDASKRITSIVSNIAPGTYPQKYCANAQYVIELPAGVAQTSGLRVGQTAKF